MIGPAFKETVDSLTSVCAAGWRNVPATPPVFVGRTSEKEKAQKEQEIEDALSTIRSVAEQQGRRSGCGKAAINSRIRATVAQLLLPDDRADIEQFFEDCQTSANEFASRAAEFDPKLSETDIFQALRNLWVFNSLQFSTGRSVRLSSSSFGYSLLYPYTDNILDDPEKSAEVKQSVIRSLGKLLCDSREEIPGPCPENLTRLVGMISDEYSPAGFPEVHNSLRAIHEAQCSALRLQYPVTGCDERDLLRLTIAKGGTSVLADGYLVNGDLDTPSRRAAFGYGVLLQLIDDLQDLEEDSARGHSTPFTRALSSDVLGEATNQLFHYTRWILSLMKVNESPRERKLLKLIDRTCLVLILEAIDRHRKHYPADYLRTIEEYSPVRLSHFADVRRRVPNSLAAIRRMPISRNLVCD